MTAMTRRARYRLVIFDLDGTLVQLDKSVWQLLHEALGTDLAERQATMRRAKSGAISYDEWFHTDLVMLREAGATQEDVTRVLGTLRVQEGAHALLEALRLAGSYVAVISGGLRMTVDQAFPDFEFDSVFINQMSYGSDGAIIGGTSTPYDGAGKAVGLQLLAEKWGLRPSEIAFVGDGSNDVAIAQAAAMSVAWGDAHPKLRDVATHHFPGPDLRDLFPLLMDG